LIYPEGDVLKERVRNRYSLVVLASKRAKQIKEGAPVLIDTSSTNHLTIALEEIAAGKVSFSEHLETPEDDESPAYAPTIDFGVAQAAAMLPENSETETEIAFDTQAEEHEDEATPEMHESETSAPELIEFNAGQAVTAAEEA
jgi:DNA-directed RNA polymerase subunit omega